MVRLAVMVFILHEKVLVCAVSGEEDGGRAEAWQGAAETVPAGKGTLESPGITVNFVKLSLALYCYRLRGNIEGLSCWIRKGLTLAPRGRIGAWLRPP